MVGLFVQEELVRKVVGVATDREGKGYLRWQQMGKGRDEGRERERGCTEERSILSLSPSFCLYPQYFAEGLSRELEGWDIVAR